MSVSNVPIFPQTIQSEAIQILPATGSTLVTLYTAGANGSKIENIIATNTDSTTAYLITLTFIINGISYPVTTINVPLSSGLTNSAPAISLLKNANLPTASDSNGNPYLYMGAGTLLKVNSSTTVTSGQSLSFVALGGDY